MAKQKLELTWIGKENRSELEPRILLEDRTKSYHAKHRVASADLFDNRLEIIKRLLSEDGSLWITLDDNEAHYLKASCDELFGRGSFVATVILQKSTYRSPIQSVPRSLVISSWWSRSNFIDSISDVYRNQRSELGATQIVITIIAARVRLATSFATRLETIILCRWKTCRRSRPNRGSRPFSTERGRNEENHRHCPAERGGKDDLRA